MFEGEDDWEEGEKVLIRDQLIRKDAYRSTAGLYEILQPPTFFLTTPTFGKEMSNWDKSIYVFVADGTEEMELVITYDILGQSQTLNL